ncbi:OB-fold protein [Bradyrhizobium japonicum]|uniref:OB-fold protein n=1 Tax=Bradyrhizobium japonicum TaxID=375 RepID=UPI00117F7385|nr:hypothetical protein [Bradyrhizobium japonicum]
MVFVYALSKMVGPGSDSSTGGSSTTTRTDIRTGIVSGSPTEVVRVTAVDLFRQYDDNEVATDNRLKGKIIEVSGRVQSINKDFLDHVYVTLATPNQFMSASMHVPKSEEPKMAELRKGQAVALRCLKMKRWVGSPSGDDCVLMGSD